MVRKSISIFSLYSLRKMVANIKRKIQSSDNALYHHGLVKILIEAHLNIKGDNWEDFLVQNHFKKVEQDEFGSKLERIH